MENYFQEFMGKFRWNFKGAMIKNMGRFYFWLGMILLVVGIINGRIDFNMSIIWLMLIVMGSVAGVVGIIFGWKAVKKKHMVSQLIHRQCNLMLATMVGTSNGKVMIDSERMINYASILIAADQSRENNEFRSDWIYFNQRRLVIKTDITDENRLFHHLQFFEYIQADKIMKIIAMKGGINDLFYETNYGRCGIIHLVVLVAYWGWQESVDYLLNLGADINLPNSLGWTPLHLAVMMREDRVAKRLVRWGADPSIVNETGIRPIDLVKSDLFDGIGVEENMPYCIG